MTDIGTRRFPWWELKLIVLHQPYRESAVYREQLKHEDYTYTDVLLTQMLNRLNAMVWQLGGDADAPRPEPVLMPGQDAPDEGFDRMSIEEMDERLAPYMPRK